MSFLHGIRFIRDTSGIRPIRTPRTAVIALVGTAPSGPVNQLTLVNNPNAAAQFGAEVSGFTIPQTLKAIFANGGATVLVVNVADLDAMDVSATQTLTITNRKVKVTNSGFIAVTSVATTGGSPVTLVANTDYTVDAYGAVTILNAAYADGSSLSVVYRRLDPSLVTTSALIGTVNGTTGARTGMQLWDRCYSLFGFRPKLLLAPWFSQLSAVRVEMTAKANKYKGKALCDTAAGMTPQAVLEERGVGGDYNFSQRSVVLCWPWLKQFSPDSNTDVALPFSAAYAGAIANSHAQRGFWFSPSNIAIQGVTGYEYQVVGDGLTDENADWNLLNAAGVVTLYVDPSAGPLIWGNTTTAFPGTTQMEDVFISVGTVQDTIEDALEFSIRPFIDLPITQAWIDSVRASVNAYYRTLKSYGALVYGECEYHEADNDPTELAQGKVTFRLVSTPPPPAQTIIFKHTVDITKLVFK